MVELQNIIATDLKSRYCNDDMTEILNICTYFDPRFRLEYVGDDVDNILQRVKAEAIKVHVVNTETRSVSDDSQSQPPPQKKQKGLGAILRKAFSDSEQTLKNKYKKKWIGIN